MIVHKDVFGFDIDVGDVLIKPTHSWREEIVVKKIFPKSLICDVPQMSWYTDPNGYWKVRPKPNSFKEKRINLTQWGDRLYNKTKIENLKNNDQSNKSW